MRPLCVPSLCGHHCCMRCVAIHGVSSHCSSLPPCSEMMFQQVTLIDPSLHVHTSHAVCASISTCMCDAIQFCNLLPAGRAVYVLGRSYKAEPRCKPEEMLFDNWMDRSHSHAMSPHCQPCILPSCVPHSIVHHVWSLEFDQSCQSLPPNRAHACSYGISFEMKHTVECLTEFTDTGPTM